MNTITPLSTASPRLITTQAPIHTGLSTPYMDPFAETTGTYTFAAIDKEALVIFLLLAFAIGTAVGCAYLMGFDEQFLTMGTHIAALA